MIDEHVTAPVRGGSLTAGVWGAGTGEAVLAFHGITASHVSWRAVARSLDGTRTVIAPDLRGRGGSRELPGPFGMAQHATDAAKLLDFLGIDRVDIVGHSMGGFVGMRFAADYPERVRGITLIDGGVPLPLPTGIPIEKLMKATLGPALARLEETYPTRESYRAFWRAHPAFVGEWNEDIEAYVDYDLVGAEPDLRSSASGVAALADSVEQGVGTVADEPWSVVKSPITFLRAPRGLLNGPALYDADYLAGFVRTRANPTVVEAPDVNHYTILMTQSGADAVADAIQSAKEPA
ncbi:MAG TPA: alpha/beta hydrolase [Galbitalea sp.]|jgi:pimeloyl-ACP methyl ester carboxylesterase|nr:alpha/beta hydrolase [Galbitalea sp.]